MRALSVAEVCARLTDVAQRSNSSDGGFDLPAMAELLRRAARLRCPCTEAALLHAALDPLRGLERALAPGSDDPAAALDELARQALTGLLDDGDLASQVAGRTRGAPLLYLHPLVTIQVGRWALVVGSPDATREPALGKLAISREGHRRWLPLDEPRAADADALKTTGAAQLSPEEWARGPTPGENRAALAEKLKLLEIAGPPGELEDLQIFAPGQLDYRRRWISRPEADPGTYLARYPSRYEGYRWCLVSLEAQGYVACSTPIGASDLWPAHAEAWRLAAALHAHAGVPERWSERAVGAREIDFTLSLPAPPWVARQLTLLSAPHQASPARWRVRREEVEHARSLLRAQLFMEQRA